MGNIAGVSGRDPQMRVQTTVTPGPTIEDTTVDIWNRIMDVNVKGVYLGTKFAIPPMRATGGGSIINISSICGLVGSFGNAAYHASKGAVRIFSKATALQHAADKIRANSIKNYLNSKGIGWSRMKSVGLGESKPVAENITSSGLDNKQGRQKNRRVEFLVQ